MTTTMTLKLKQIFSLHLLINFPKMLPGGVNSLKVTEDRHWKVLAIHIPLMAAFR